MNIAAKKFYDAKYSKGLSQELAPGLMSILYKFFIKFERNRTSVVYDLIEPGKRILDIGLGGGRLLSLCKLNNKFEEYCGLDIVGINISEAKKYIKKSTGDLRNVYVVLSDANGKLPYRNGFFDTIVCVAVLEHLFDPYWFMSEVARVLKPGGRLIVEVPNLA